MRIFEVQILSYHTISAISICSQGLEWSWQDWECKSLIADSNLVIPEVLDRQMRFSSSYRDYNYDKIYDDERDGCGEGFEWSASFQACVDIDECSSGSAACGDNKECVNLEGAYNCVCRQGYEKQIPKGIDDPEIILGSDLDKCVDINECEHDCNSKGQECINTIGSYICNCQPGFRLDDFGNCIDINECDEQTPCGSNAICRNLIGNYECDCFKDFHRNILGECVKADICMTKGNICQWQCMPENNGESFTCVCPDGFMLIGNTCTDINECNLNPCDENHICLNNHGSVTCKEKTPCPAGFTAIKGWKNEFERTKQDTNICHRDFRSIESCDSNLCDYDSVQNHYADILNNSHPDTKVFRFYRTASYGYSANYGYIILAVTDYNGNDVMEQNEFKINPKYRNRPMAYLRAAKTIPYNEDGNQKRHITIEYFASDRRSGQILYKELIHIHVFISKYDF